MELVKSYRVTDKAISQNVRLLACVKRVQIVIIVVVAPDL